MAANKLAAIKEGLKRQGAIDREAIDAARREAEIPGAFGSNPAATAVGGGAILGRDLGPRFAAWLRGEGEKR